MTQQEANQTKDNRVVIAVLGSIGAGLIALIVTGIIEMAQVTNEVENLTRRIESNQRDSRERQRSTSADIKEHGAVPAHGSVLPTLAEMRARIESIEQDQASNHNEHEVIEREHRDHQTQLRVNSLRIDRLERILENGGISLHPGTGP